jgi:hypothetical protein
MDPGDKHRDDNDEYVAAVGVSSEALVGPLQNARACMPSA